MWFLSSWRNFCCFCLQWLWFILWTVELNLWKSRFVAVTSPGRLPCQYIFHIAADHGIERGIKACLEEAARRLLSSITFPLLGTGVYCQCLFSWNNLKFFLKISLLFMKCLIRHYHTIWYADMNVCSGTDGVVHRHSDLWDTAEGNHAGVVRSITALHRLQCVVDRNDGHIEHKFH